MHPRAALLPGVALLAGLAASAIFLRPAPAPPPDPIADSDLPIPPIPPRIAQGADYEKCLATIATDPAAAAADADAWEATGGGDGATHCRGLALVAAGEVEPGATLLEALATRSRAPAVARATVYGEANQAWLIAGEPDRALATATQAIRLSPQDPDLLVDHAVTEARLQHYQDAIDDLDAAIDSDPRRADALVFRGSAWRHLGQPDLAADDIARALAIDADNADALLERGLLAAQDGDADRARADWQRVQAVAPQTPAAGFAQQDIGLLDQRSQ